MDKAVRSDFQQICEMFSEKLQNETFGIRNNIGKNYECL